MTKEESVLNYYILCNKLKNLLEQDGKIGKLKEKE